MKSNAHNTFSGNDPDFLHALVVDDEPIMRDLLRAMLIGMKVEVDVAENGLEAKKKLLSGDYELVITDINMPEMDGIALLRWLKEERPDIEAVVMTGYEMTEEMLRVIGESAVECFAKPPQQQQIKVAVLHCREKIRVQGNA